MVVAAWRSLHDELARWRDAGRRVAFWWRDDDATYLTAELSRLFELAGRSGVPLALAVVPQNAQPSLLASAVSGIVALQHGVDHQSRAEQGSKKTEFSTKESIDAALQRLAIGQARLEEVAGPRALRVLVPPWNRLASHLVPRLAEAGYAGLSTFGVCRNAEPAPGLRQVNTHVDIIDWKGGRRFAGDEAILEQAVRHLTLGRTGQTVPDEPTGWLTHHAVHDEAAWEFLARLFESTDAIAGVDWLRPEAVFTRVR